jgi:hypothetical protein
MSDEGWRVAWSCWRSFRNSSEIERRRTIISASASLSRGRLRLLTRRSPAGHHGRLSDAPHTMAIGTPVGGDFRTRRECFGCPTGQAVGSVARARCRIHIPVTLNFPDHLYQHATFPMLGGRETGLSRINAAINMANVIPGGYSATSPSKRWDPDNFSRTRAWRRDRHGSGSRSQGIHRHREHPRTQPWGEWRRRRRQARSDHLPVRRTAHTGAHVRTAVRLHRTASVSEAATARAARDLRRTVAAGNAKLCQRSADNRQFRCRITRLMNAPHRIRHYAPGDMNASP